MAYNKNQAESLKPTQPWLHHHLLHPFWVTLLSSPRPHPLASASKSKWLQMMAACLPEHHRGPFLSTVSEQSFSWEQKVLDSSNAAPPTAHSPEWCCNFHKPPCDAWRVVFLFIFYLFSFLGLVGRPGSVFSWNTENKPKNNAFLLLFVTKCRTMCIITRHC